MPARSGTVMSMISIAAQSARPSVALRPQERRQELAGLRQQISPEGVLVLVAVTNDDEPSVAKDAEVMMGGRLADAELVRGFAERQRPALEPPQETETALVGKRLVDAGELRGVGSGSRPIDADRVAEDLDVLVLDQDHPRPLPEGRKERDVADVRPRRVLQAVRRPLDELLG